jgi:hypothetical protein
MPTGQPALESFNVPRYVINRLIGVRRVGDFVECFFGLGAPGIPCAPDYSVVVAVRDVRGLLAEIAGAMDDDHKVISIR